MGMDRDPNVYDRDTTVANRDTTVVDRDAGGSNFLAFLIGGLVIAIGLLAFLFYDGASTAGRDVSTTGSTTRSAPANAAPTGPMTAPAPAPSGSATSTSATAAPAAPARP